MYSVTFNSSLTKLTIMTIYHRSHEKREYFPTAVNLNVFPSSFHMNIDSISFQNTCFQHVILSMVCRVDAYSAFFPPSTTLPPSITIDVDKGIVFEQLGYYSEKLQQQVFHIFITFNNLCLETPYSDVCLYTKSIDSGIKQIEMFTAYTTGMDSTYNRKSIAQIIKNDIQRVFHNHEVEKFLSVTKSTIVCIFHLLSTTLL